MKLPDFDFDFRLFGAPPMLLVAVVLIGSFVPMIIGAAIWHKRNSFTSKPRIHIFQDMDNQAYLKAQASTPLFADGKAMQDYAPGTVAWGRSTRQTDPGMLLDSDLAYRGFALDPATGAKIMQDDAEGNSVEVYLDGFPDIVEINDAFLALGQQQYNDFCMTCHGKSGLGNGATHVTSDRLANQPNNPTGTNWVPPKNLIEEVYTADAGYSNGQLFDVISNGRGNMAGYSARIDIVDRWAIVAYVRALQLSQEIVAQPEPEPEEGEQDNGSANAGQ